jgi:hypothetical protein
MPKPSNPLNTGIDLTQGDHELVIAFDLNQGFGWGLYTCFEVPENQRKTRRKPCFPRGLPQH